MKLYLAGPMRGYPRFNFDAFDEAARYLRDLGYEVVSPAELDREIDGFDPDAPVVLPLAHYARRALECVIACDVVALLPGWEQSNGAQMEAAMGVFLGKSVYKERGSYHTGECNARADQDAPRTQ